MADSLHLHNSSMGDHVRPFMCVREWGVGARHGKGEGMTSKVHRASPHQSRGRSHPFTKPTPTHPDPIKSSLDVPTVGPTPCGRRSGTPSQPPVGAGTQVRTASRNRGGGGGGRGHLAPNTRHRTHEVRTGMMTSFISATKSGTLKLGSIWRMVLWERGKRADERERGAGGYWRGGAEEEEEEEEEGCGCLCVGSHRPG